MIKYLVIEIIGIVFFLGNPLTNVSGQSKSRPRLIILTDITSIESGVEEPDDAQSMIRLLLYSNEFDIEGIIASSGLIHGQVVRPENIRAIVDAYAKDRPKLLLHDKNYPDAEKLRRVIKSGQPAAGKNVAVFKSIGKGKDTEGSDWIIKMVDKVHEPDQRPLWIAIWGGSADLAQALWKIKNTRSANRLKYYISKIRVLAIGDQDATGLWIKSSFPDLFYITRGTGGRGIYREGDTALVSSAWVQQHIKGHGALGDLYPDYNGGDIWSKKLGRVRGIKDGDGASILGLINNGLNQKEHVTWENWGGRLERDSVNPNHYHDAIDNVGSYKTDVSPYLAAVYRWRQAFQNDFQARLDWCINPYSDANHEPKNDGGSVVKKYITAGEKIVLHAGNWSDPDSNNLTYDWQVLSEEGTYHGKVNLKDTALKSCYFIAPPVKRIQSIHLLLTVTDNGAPALTRYQRFNTIISPNIKTKEADE